MQDLTLFINNHPLLSLATLAIFALLLVVEFMRTKRRGSQLTPLQTTQMMNHDNAVVIDVRANDIYRKGHILDAQNMSAQEVKENTKKLEKLKGKPLIFICGTGHESQKLAASMQKQGYNAYSLAGGLRAWLNAQMPLVKE